MRVHLKEKKISAGIGNELERNSQHGHKWYRHIVIQFSDLDMYQAILASYAVSFYNVDDKQKCILQLLCLQPVDDVNNA